jgi:hypothetical protein
VGETVTDDFSASSLTTSKKDEKEDDKTEELMKVEEKKCLSRLIRIHDVHTDLASKE